MSESNKVLVTLENGVKRITINRPERRNAVDTESIALLTEAIASSADDASRVLILTGSGDSFCAGADLQASGTESLVAKDVTKALREGVNPLITAMRTLPKPIVGRVHGHAVGVGCNFALACDLIFASEEARFSQIFIKIGLMPDGGGTYLLPRLVGYHKAFELMATGDVIGAEEAFALGLVNRVVPLAELDATVNSVAELLAQSPGIALARIKAGLNNGLDSDLASALEFEAVNQGDCFRSKDFAEGVTAFLQKRKAVFTGK